MPRGRPEGLNQTEKDLLFSILVSTAKSPSHETWGYALQKTVEEMFDKPLSWGTLFPALRRLEARGLVESRWQQPDGAVRRKMYRLTGEGEQLAGALRETVGQAQPTTSLRGLAHA